MIFSHDKGNNVTLFFRQDEVGRSYFFLRKSGESLVSPTGFVNELQASVLMLPVIYQNITNPTSASAPRIPSFTIYFFEKQYKYRRSWVVFLAVLVNSRIN
jgi:hypothetical protein